MKRQFLGLIFIRTVNSKITDQINILDELLKIKTEIESPFLIIVEWKKWRIKS